MSTEKAVNNYMQEELRQEVAPSPEAKKRVASPPAGSANNTWSASTEVDRVVKSRAEGRQHQASTDEGRDSNSE